MIPQAVIGGNSICGHKFTIENWKEVGLIPIHATVDGTMDGPARRDLKLFRKIIKRMPDKTIQILDKSYIKTVTVYFSRNS